MVTVCQVKRDITGDFKRTNLMLGLSDCSERSRRRCFTARKGGTYGFRDVAYGLISPTCLRVSPSALGPEGLSFDIISRHAWADGRSAGSKLQHSPSNVFSSRDTVDRVSKFAGGCLDDNANTIAGSILFWAYGIISVKV